MAPSGEVTVAAVVSSIEQEYQDEWDYYLDEKPAGIVGPVEVTCDREGDVGFGDVLACEAAPLEERESYPDPFLIRILVTGDDGSTWHSRVPEAHLEEAYLAVGSGLFCRDLFEPEGPFFAYPAAVTYWFWEGRPDRMDADRDGIPCETVYPLSAIADFWQDPSRAEDTEIHFGYITELTAAGPPYEMTIDYATMLSGIAASRAAEAAGEIQPGEGVPNDFFISNEDPELRTLAMAADVELFLMASLEGEGIASIPVDPDLWVVLFEAAGRCAAADWASPECSEFGGEDWLWYGLGTLPYWIQLEGDTVVRVEEQYLP